MSIETSELLEEFIDAITQGQPPDSDWVSIDENARRRQAYYDRLAIVRAELDRRIPASSPQESDMAEKMTLGQVREAIAEYGDGGGFYEKIGIATLIDWKNAIDAHLAQPAQAVDVGAIKEVIAWHLREWQNFTDRGTPWCGDEHKEQADTLTRAIGNAQTVGQKMCVCITEGQRAYCAGREKCCRAYALNTKATPNAHE